MLESLICMINSKSLDMGKLDCNAFPIILWTSP
jgi:hypothetical protein